MNTFHSLVLTAALIAGSSTTVQAQSGGTDKDLPHGRTTQASVNADWQWSKTPNGAYDQIPVKDTRGAPLAWQPIRESDLTWKKRVWREINTLEKQNQAFTYAGDEHTGGGMLIEILMDAIKTGKAPAYATSDDRFTRAFTREELLELVKGRADTNYLIDPTNDSEIIAISYRDFNPRSITKYRIIEDWLFDNNTGQMTVRIAGIAPVRDVYDDNNQYRGSQAMFWMYYPEIRGVLAGYEAVNPDNDVNRVTWDDFFESRRFSGRITKVSNAHGDIPGSYGESISEHARTPMEALYEGRRAANTIFNKEHDMWNY